MIRQKHIVFLLLAVVVPAFVTVVLLLGADYYLHKKSENEHLYNIWGYRGPTVGEKQSGEQRIVVLGGSTAFGFGVTHKDSFPSHLERKLNLRRRDHPIVRVLNLAYNNEGAHSFSFTLEDFEYLEYDVILLYSGYNDLGAAPNLWVSRHNSAVFKLTGYWPVLPMIVRERMFLLRYDDVDAGYRGKKVAFTPGPLRKTAAFALETFLRTSQALESQLGKLTDPDVVEVGAELRDCGEGEHYCSAIARAVDFGLSLGKRVLVVTQPYIADTHVEQQTVMSGMLRRRWSDEARLRYVNLGRTVSLKNPALAYDGMHLTGLGNEKIAEALVEPLLGFLGGKDY